MSYQVGSYFELLSHLHFDQNHSIFRHFQVLAHYLAKKLLIYSLCVVHESFQSTYLARIKDSTYSSMKIEKPLVEQNFDGLVDKFRFILTEQNFDGLVHAKVVHELID